MAGRQAPPLHACCSHAVRLLLLPTASDMTIDLSSCEKPQIKNGFAHILKAANLVCEEHQDEFHSSLKVSPTHP